MNATTILVILGAIALIALGIGIGVWKKDRKGKEFAKEQGDKVVKEVENTIRQDLKDKKVDDKTAAEILKSEETKKEIDAISKEPDEAERLKKLAELTNKLTKGN
jgi:FtsZ-interacting cell division protein ZipA